MKIGTILSMAEEKHSALAEKNQASRRRASTCEALRRILAKRDDQAVDQAKPTKRHRFEVNLIKVAGL